MASEERRGRAPPRKAKKDPEEAPLFLQKTYQMVDTSQADIVSWTEAGDTFVVKNLEEFCNLLPTFFKHRNFRSFVRQLNFYGFRKLRADSVPVRRPDGWWEFKHEKFLKGKPELLIQIKRADHYEDENAAKDKKKENEKPIHDLEPLQSRIDQMTTTIEQLTNLVDSLLLERATGIINPDIPIETTSASEALSKKRKMFTTPSAPLKPFGDEPQQAELEDDEAILLSHLSIEPTMSADMDVMDRPDLERSFSGFDFSDPNDAGLKPVQSIPRSTSSSSVGNEIFAHPYVMDFFAKLSTEVPKEPHVSENRNLMRTTSSSIQIPC
jgi:hypothetical protein